VGVRRHGVITCVVLWACAAAAADGEFPLRLEEELARPRVDPRTEARLAQWDSPMGRLMYDMQQQQGTLMRGGQPGGSSGLAFRLKFQKGLSPAVMAATIDGGVELYERAVHVVRWPWKEDGGEAMPMEEQLTLLLGHRLEAPTAGAPADEDNPEDD
jgi:hypothetical protein